MFGEMNMSRKRTSGLIGMGVGGLWFLNGLRYFHDQGFVAIGMPLLLLGLGVVYFILGGKEA